MQKIKTEYMRVDRSDIISKFGLETYEKLHAWMKEDGFGHPHPCGGGNFDYDLELYYEEPFEDEEPFERIHDDEFCPEFLEMMVKTLKKEQKEKYNNNLPLIYVVEAWQ